MDDTSIGGGAYTAMENKTSKLLLAHRLSAATAVQDAFDGKLALTAVAAKALSRDEVWALKVAMNGYYGLAL